MAPTKSQDTLLLHVAASMPHGQVYACFAALGVAGTMESTAVHPEGMAVLRRLPHADAAVMAAIQEYAALREGEAWHEVKAALAAEGVQPTPEDRYTHAWFAGRAIGMLAARSCSAGGCHAAPPTDIRYHR